MKKIILYISLIIVTLQSGISQTIVKMNLPQQAKESLRVVVLFNEEVPSGMPVVLGLMGYQVSGGMAPYIFEWYQNDKLIGSQDIVTLTPSNGDKLTLKVIDKNRCLSQSAVSMKVKNMVDNGKDDLSGGISVLPTLVRSNQIHVKLPQLKSTETALVRIFDMDGKEVYSTNILKSQPVDFNLAVGNYFVSVRTDEFHFVERIFVQH